MCSKEREQTFHYFDSSEETPHYRTHDMMKETEEEKYEVTETFLEDSHL